MVVIVLNGSEGGLVGFLQFCFAVHNNKLGKIIRVI